MNELWFISLERKYWLSGWHSNNAHTSHCCDMSYIPGIDMTLWDGNMVNKSGRWIPPKQTKTLVPTIWRKCCPCII